jgi:Fe-S-cluster containining protein
MKEKKECKRCGKCCTDEEILITVKATSKDIERWVVQGRYDILDYLEPIIDYENGEEEFEQRGLFFDPITKERLDRCPFFKRIENGLTQCRIHDTKPSCCENYYCT